MSKYNDTKGNILLLLLPLKYEPVWEMIWQLAPEMPCKLMLNDISKMCLLYG